MFSGFKHVLLLLLTMCPAAENNLSDGVEIAGIQMTAFASLAILGNLALLSFHHSRTLILFYVYTLFQVNKPQRHLLLSFL